jgi:hypothetical protein
LPHGPSSGDGGAASGAVFANISVVAFDGAGNLYVVDGALVRRIRVDGTIATIAGGGAGPIQDGSAATGVNLSSVTAMTVDAAVDLYIGTRNFIRYVDSQTGVNNHSWQLQYRGSYRGVRGECVSRLRGHRLLPGFEWHALVFRFADQHTIQWDGEDSSCKSAGFEPPDGSLATAVSLKAPMAIAVSAADELISLIVCRAIRRWTRQPAD